MREFQAILAKDDTDMNEVDEEFMWSKRENLRSFPEALPKVLLSAPEKNYTGMTTTKINSRCDVFCLYTSWE